MTRTEIIKIARSYIGTPFRHQGRQKGIGIDCVGLLVCVMRECGLQVEDQANYNGLIDAGLLRSKLGAHLVEIPIDQISPGDVVLLYVSKRAQHIGIVADGNPELTLIHTHDNASKVIEVNLWGWQKRIVSAYRFPGVEI